MRLGLKPILSAIQHQPNALEHPEPRHSVGTCPDAASNATPRQISATIGSTADWSLILEQTERVLFLLGQPVLAPTSSEQSPPGESPPKRQRIVSHNNFQLFASLELPPVEDSPTLMHTRSPRSPSVDRSVTSSACSLSSFGDKLTNRSQLRRFSHQVNSPLNPHQCNACGIKDFPEWSRYNDLNPPYYFLVRTTDVQGPRTLCNACGLMYAKMKTEECPFRPASISQPSSPTKVSLQLNPSSSTHNNSTSITDNRRH